MSVLPSTLQNVATALRDTAIQMFTDPFGLRAQQERREYAVDVIRIYSGMSEQEAEAVLQRISLVSQRSFYPLEHTERAFLQGLHQGEDVNELLRLFEKWVGLDPQWIVDHLRELRIHEARKTLEPQEIEL